MEIVTSVRRLRGLDQLPDLPKGTRAVSVFLVNRREALPGNDELKDSAIAFQTLRQAVELGQLCANDPVCAQHRPDSTHEDRLLHGAACHGCLLLPENSCERRNDFLDRSLVVPTVDDGGAAFFDQA